MSDTAVAYLVGQTVLFAGYSPDEKGNLPDPALLIADERVRIDRVQDDGSFVVYALDRKNEDDGEIGDAAFPEELKHTGDPADLEVGPKKKAAPKKKDTKVKETKEVKEVKESAPAPPAEKPLTKAQQAKAAKAAEKAAKEAEAIAQNDAAKPQTAEEEAAFVEATDEELAAQEGRPSNAPVAEDDGEGVVGEIEEEGTEGEEETQPEQKLPGGIKLTARSMEGNFAPFEDTDAVKKILRENRDVLDAAKALAKRQHQNDFALGGVLNHIHTTGIWKTAKDSLGQNYEGKRGFTQYINDHLDIEYRKAMYLIKIYTVFRRLGQDEKSLEAMGWSKAKELAAAAATQDEDGNEIGLEILKERFDEFQSFAINNTREALVAKIKTDLIPTFGDQSTRTRYSFTLTDEAAKNADAALTAAKERVQAESEEGKKNAAFEYIMSDWALHNADMTLEDAIDSLQNRFGVRLKIDTDAVADEDQEEVAGNA